jgi:lipid A 3-O-deacylase PagL
MAAWLGERYCPANFRFTCLIILSALSILVPQAARSQETAGVAEVQSPAANLDRVTTLPSESNMPSMEEAHARAAKPTGQHVESELIVEGLASYGNYRIFASGWDCKLYTAGLEYDRHSWGYFLKSRIDYVAEVLPFMLLNAPAKNQIYGGPVGSGRKLVPGVDISPIGFRMMWRPKKTIRPYLTAKGGMLAFSQKEPSSQATYENFSLQSGMGIQVMMTPTLGLRLGLFNDFHFSNAFIVPINPGLDVMNAGLGLSWHFNE